MLTDGTFFINRWFATVEFRRKTLIPIGYEGVVVSYFGNRGQDVPGQGFRYGEQITGRVEAHQYDKELKRPIGIPASLRWTCSSHGMEVQELKFGRRFLWVEGKGCDPAVCTLLLDGIGSI